MPVYKVESDADGQHSVIIKSCLLLDTEVHNTAPYTHAGLAPDLPLPWVPSWRMDQILIWSPRSPAARLLSSCPLPPGQPAA